MKVLFTGASSFTGLWFIGRLAAAGAEIVAPLRGAPASYSGMRAERERYLSKWAQVVPDCAFGGEKFLDLIRGRAFDVLCHHAAEARDYRSLDFDVAGALAANTRNLREVLTTLRERGLKAVVATGSVFEPEEGAGPSPRRAFSPYGLSKGLTWRTLEYWGETLGIPVSKFVIANPFGPFEEPRFVAYAVERWAKGEPVEVRTPRYLRDNIHVDLLAGIYAKFVAEAAAGGQGRRFGPCGYLETQGAFAERLGRELGARLGFPGEVTFAEQTDFSEPLARVNGDTINPTDYGWSETKAWDGLAGYYRQRGFTGVAKRTPEVRGHVDIANRDHVAGWLAGDPGGAPRYARVVVDDVERGVARADGWRPDLLAMKISDGHSGFRFYFPGGLDPYADLTLRVEDRETGQALAGRLRLPKLVGGDGSPFHGDGDVAVVNVGSATYEGGRVRILLELFGAATRFGAPFSRNATFTEFETTPVRHPYFDACGVPVSRLRMVAEVRDPGACIDIGFAEADARLACFNVIPGRMPDYLDQIGPENMARVSGADEQAGRFAATGMATAYRLNAIANAEFGQGLAGACLDWGAGPGRVALPLARVIAPGLRVTATDVDAFNVAHGRARFPDIAFVEAPFLPPLPFADGTFDAIYGVSVLTHLTESAQFAWLKELRRLVRPGAPVIVSAHSEYQLFRAAATHPDILAEAATRGISDKVLDGNLGPKLAEKTYYRATFHTRAYIRANWTDGFEVVRIYPFGNGASQDFVALRAV